VTPAEPIRIARIITRLNVGGPAIQAVTLSDRLEAAGYHTLLIHGRLGVGEGDMSYLIPTDRRFEVEPIRSLRREVAPAADAAALSMLARRLRTFRPHIVHTHMAKAGTLGRLAALAANALGGQRRARVVHTYHGHVLDGYFHAGVAGVFSAAERTLARRSDALIAVSPLVERDLIETHHIGDVDRFHVIPLGFDLQRFAAIGESDRAAARREFNLPASAHVVAWVGRLTPIKQPELFLAAARRMTMSDPDATFLIAGGGDMEASFRAEVAASGLAPRIKFLGWQRDVARVYAASDLTVLTSRNEGTPVALVESMAAAVPGVAFAVGGVPDVVDSSEVGVLVPASDVEALAARAVALLGDASARRIMGERARANVLARYGIDRLVRDVDALYRELL
jgi:glycosyltransferase involved in cell wall biosynthesis